ncbi:CDP-diacylglycerol/serine O-phosphatidyltransferase [Anaeromyxobacter sp. K]|uniref:CDP-diacylglycerol--serine O-phosphatidyltransferase n=1 Tax=Anaeromyxobacter dehalogenans (strain ATCC BAA-258 / DSM 21875 / 2CP-1) TaxID=455488 RepID=B8J6V4_ANAD2|nr:MULTISPECIES: CDP-diacylglycerol--serine O-phosphatidyltransferase [Anaeromyxobacter]ACG74893.1 CDP-diacylglycerol/serine O-phosphatidyltransferase [Anaeromyxobacter sp. K]ACL67076.1 CDP-diacylglycerol/serine O-phosphatidyltransferase [Anaeromyxobacter dehalogenans 2CP-1]
MQINLRKAMFVLPNLFTVSSIFLGFYALTLSAGDATPAQLYQAALAIFFAMFFDAFDGRVARMTKTQSDFGVQLDSLADVISFGAAPALLVYKWALAPLGFIGLFFSFAFAACGALRLARFNVLAQRGDKGSSAFFVGLPIPLAAGTITALVIAHYKEFGAATNPATRVPVLVVVALLSFLMVSTVRYRTFKDVHLSARSLSAFVLASAVGLAVAYATRASFALVVYMGAYIAMGLAESLFEKARTLDRSRLPPDVRAELDADEALEPGPEDVDGDKAEQDEYI